MFDILMIKLKLKGSNFKMNDIILFLIDERIIITSLRKKRRTYDYINAIQINPENS